jgi:outer membrane protein OmpA-like peptidoglycan-associated protein
MTTRFARSLARLTIITSLVASLGACDTLASLDPTGLFGGDTPATDNSAAASPDLASVPSAPPTTDDQRDVATSLAATGAQTQYSADTLRAGTEASAPPPGAAPSASQLALAAPPSADAPPTSDAAPTSAPAASASSTSDANTPAGAMPSIPVSNAPAAPAAATSVPANPAQSAAAPPISVSDAPVTPAAAPVQTASLAPPISVSNAPVTPAVAPVQTAPMAPPSDSSGAAAVTPAGAEPAVPAVPPAGAIHSTIMTPPVMSDAALGFKPSTAPPLDPSVSNFVSQPILARYDRTAALAGVGSVSSSNAAVPVNSSAVVASAGDMTGLNGGLKPTAVVFFPGDGTALSTAARKQIRTAVAAFKASGGTATVRVVGHASSRTADMPVEKHLEVIFEKSHKRALAVLQELVRRGVPADHVQVDAVGDSQPIYFESMPKGEEGNRRAEIFVQG